MDTIQELYRKSTEFRESRLKSLFADYTPLKESNFEGYNANLNVWKHFLPLAFKSQSSLTFNYEVLLKELTYKTSNKTYTPEGLYIALNEMLNTDKSIILSSQVEEIGKKKVKKSSIFSTIGQLLFGSGIIDVRNKNYTNQSLVFVSKIKEYSETIKSNLTPLLKDGPINIDHLQSILREKEFKITDNDLIYSLLYLSQDVKELTVFDGIIYSVEKSEEEKVNTDDLKHITDLNYTIYKLHLYNDEKLKEISELDKKIKQSLKDKNQITARSELKLKKLLEIQVKKTLSSLENLHKMKIKVEDAQNNLLISKVWKDNSNVLKLLNEKAMETDLDDMFDSLYDEIQTTSKISDQLGQIVTTSEDEEINQELSELEASMNKEKKGDVEVDAIRKKLDDLKIPDKKPESVSKEETAAKLTENRKRVAILSE